MNFIDPTAHIGEGCSIGYGAVIEKDVRLGDGCRIEHGAVIYEGTQLGADCRVGAYAVLGKKPEAAPTSFNKAPADIPHLQLGDGCIVGAHAVVYRGATVGQKCLLADFAFVRDNTQIGDYVIIGTQVIVENRVKIGSYAKVQSGAYITAATTIEDRAFIAPCVITTNDNFMGRTQERFKTWGGPTIRYGARVGAGVTLLPNVEVGKESFIAAGSIVTRDTPAKTLLMGSPAKEKRPVPEDQFVENDNTQRPTP
jgi:UDP-3-O-[3-hydroxymyristoyl] glucosamine N-acyltransferase